MSFVVQALPSLQLFPMLGRPAQTPRAQTSLVVQNLPSSHLSPILGRCVQKLGNGVGLMHVSMVQNAPSSQSESLEHALAGAGDTARSAAQARATRAARRKADRPHVTALLSVVIGVAPRCGVRPAPDLGHGRGSCENVAFSGETHGRQGHSPQRAAMSTQRLSQVVRHRLRRPPHRMKLDVLGYPPLAAG